MKAMINSEAIWVKRKRKLTKEWNRDKNNEYEIKT